jgi:hypothetical protein
MDLCLSCRKGNISKDRKSIKGGIGMVVSRRAERASKTTFPKTVFWRWAKEPSLSACQMANQTGNPRRQTFALPEQAEITSEAQL